MEQIQDAELSSASLRPKRAGISRIKDPSRDRGIKSPFTWHPIQNMNWLAKGFGSIKRGTFSLGMVLNGLSQVIISEALTSTL